MERPHIDVHVPVLPPTSIAVHRGSAADFRSSAMDLLAVVSLALEGATPNQPMTLSSQEATGLAMVLMTGMALLEAADGAERVLAAVSRASVEM